MFFVYSFEKGDEFLAELIILTSWRNSLKVILQRCKLFISNKEIHLKGAFIYLFELLNHKVGEKKKETHNPVNRVGVE